MDIGSKTDNGFENGGAAAIEGKGPVLSKEEIGTIIRSKNILKKIGHGNDLNIKRICEEIGVSRKTAYGYGNCEEEEQISPSPSQEDVKSENEILKGRLKKVELENEGLRLTKMLVEDLKKKGF